MDFDTDVFPDAALDDMLVAPKCTILFYYSLCFKIAVLHHRALLSIVEPSCCKNKRLHEAVAKISRSVVDQIPARGTRLEQKSLQP